MPGPLGTIAPTTDPNWAWDTVGWTNQGNLGGDVEGQSLSAPGQGSMLVEPAALSGFIARSLDPDVTSVGTSATLTFTTTVPVLFAVQVLEPVISTGVVVPGNTAGPPTHAIAALYNATSGALVANTADLGAAGFGTTTAKFTWCSPGTSTTATIPVTSGYYWVMLVESAGTMGKINIFPSSTETQVLLGGTAAIPFTVGSTPRFATGSTGLNAVTATPAGLVTLGTLTTSMVIAKYAQTVFVGLY